MTDKIVHICNKVISIGFSVLFLFTPLLFTPGPVTIFSINIPFPTTYELFEYNKMMFVYGMTVLIAGAWILKMILQKRLILSKTPLDIPLGLFYISSILSTIFSIDPHTSIWGYYSRFNGGLLSITSYLILFYALVSNINILIVYRLILLSLISAVFVSIYGVLQHLGIDADRWQQNVRARIFSTLGQPNWLAAYLLAILPVAGSFFLYHKGKFQKIASIIVISLVFVAFIFTYSLSAFGAFFITGGLFAVFILVQKVKFKREMILIPIIFTVIIYFLGRPLWVRVINQVRFLKTTPVVQEQNQNGSSVTPQAGAEETGKIRTIVWKGAIEIAKHYEPFGSGLETFAYAYYQYRPVEHNLTTEWDFLYNKAHNEYLNYLANSGIVGFLAYMAFILTFVWVGIRTVLKNKDVFLSGLFAGWISILITNFFGFSVVAVNLLFYLIPALFFVISKKSKLWSLSFDKKRFFNNSFISSSWSYVGTFAVLVAGSFLIFSLVRIWLADVEFAKGHEYSLAGLYEQSYGYYKNALDLNSSEPFYFSEFGFAASAMAEKSMEEKDATAAASFASQARGATEAALSISPFNVTYWKTAASTYSNLYTVDPKFGQNSFEALLTAAKFAPTDAKIHYRIASIYGENGYLDQGIKLMEETIKLKPDYRDAYMELANFYIANKQPNRAKEDLEKYMKINPKDPEIVAKLKELQN